MEMLSLFGTSFIISEAFESIDAVVAFSRIITELLVSTGVCGFITFCPIALEKPSESLLPVSIVLDNSSLAGEKILQITSWLTFTSTLL